MKSTFSFKTLVCLAMALCSCVSAAPRRKASAACPPAAAQLISVEPGFASDFNSKVPKSSWLHPDCIWENHKTKTGQADLAIVSKLKVPVNRAAHDVGVDPSLIMAIIFQESHGILNIHGTVAPDGSSSNGIMQSAGCPSMEGRDVATITEEDVYSMVRCGAQHFKGNINDHVKNPKQDPYVALRLYNSGSVAPSGNLNDGNGATAHYVNEVANRLRGWSN